MTTIVNSFYDPYFLRVSMDSALMIRALLNRYMYNSDTAEVVFYDTQHATNVEFIEYLKNAYATLNKGILVAVHNVLDEHLDGIFEVSKLDDGGYDMRRDDDGEVTDDEDTLKTSKRDVEHSELYDELCTYATGDVVASPTVVHCRHELISLYNSGHLTTNVNFGREGIDLQTREAFYYMLACAGYYSDVQ